MAAPSRKRLSRKERIELGKKSRDTVKRRQLGRLNKRRAFDPIEVLLNATEGRLSELLPLKYDRMRATPFSFFRGAVPIMAADLAGQPATAIWVQLCGDAHLQNMGCFSSPDGRLVFDINDFDETVSGPWEWDVKRMASSIVLAGFDSGHSRSSCLEAAHHFAATYVATICELSAQPVLAAARHQIHRTDQVAAVSDALKQAERASPLDLLARYTTSDAKTERPTFTNTPGQLWPLSPEEEKSIFRALPLYKESLSPDRRHLFSFFKPLQAAFKVVGTGSVGLRDYVVLMQGNGPRDPLFLQIKQEVHSAYAPYLKTPPVDHQGKRVVQGQRFIQPVSDPLLGWTRIGEHDYLVRQLNDHKASIDLDKLRGEGLCSLAQVAGELLARGHARSGDSLQIAAYAGDSDALPSAIAQFAIDYAERTQSDFERFIKAIHTGRIALPETQPGTVSRAGA